MKNYFILLLAANVILSQFLQSVEGRCVNGFKTKCSVTAEITQPLGGFYSYKGHSWNMYNGFPTLYRKKHTRPTGWDRRIVVEENEYEWTRLRHRYGAFELRRRRTTAVIDTNEGHPCACHTGGKILWEIVKALNDHSHRGWLMIVDDRVRTICVGTAGRLYQPSLPYALPSYYKNFKMAHQCASWLLKLLDELGQTNDGIVTGLEVDQRNGSCKFRYAPHNLMTEYEFDDWNFRNSISNYSFCYVDIPSYKNKLPPGIWPGSAMYLEFMSYSGEYKVLPMIMDTTQFWRSSQMTHFDSSLLALRKTNMGPSHIHYPRGIWTRHTGVDADISLECTEVSRCRFYDGSNYSSWSLSYPDAQAHPLIGINYESLVVVDRTTSIHSPHSQAYPKQISYRVDGDRIDYKIQDDIVIVGAFRCAPVARKLVLSSTSTFRGYVSFRHPEILTCEHCVIHAAKRTGGGIVGVLKGPNGDCTGIGPGVQPTDYVWAETNEDGHYHCFNKEALTRAAVTSVLYLFQLYDVECKITYDAPMNSGMYKLDTTWTNNFWEFPMFISYNTRSGVGGLPYIRGDGNLNYNIRFMLCYERDANYAGGECPDYKVASDVVNGEEIRIIIAKGEHILCRSDRPMRPNSERYAEEFAIHQITSKDGVDRSYYRMTTTGCVVVPGYPAHEDITIMNDVRDPMTIDQCYNGASDDGDKVLTFNNGVCKLANRLDRLAFVRAVDSPARSCLKKADSTSADPVINLSIDRVIVEGSVDVSYTLLDS